MQQTVAKTVHHRISWLATQLAPHADEDITVEQYFEAECHRLIQRIRVGCCCCMLLIVLHHCSHPWPMHHCCAKSAMLLTTPRERELEMGIEQTGFMFARDFLAAGPL